ncbi:MAG: metallopeptidase family protein [Candidatus Paceibacterota bacterium]
MEINEFEKLVAEAAESLPENIKGAMKNVALVIEEKPRRNNLLGLYEGIPENQWGKNEAIRLPDKITIFKAAIEQEAQTPFEIKELVKIVVWHEIAHHFGFDEKETRKLEKKWKIGSR